MKPHAGNKHVKTLDRGAGGAVQLHSSIALWAIGCPGLMDLINNDYRPIIPAQELNREPQHLSHSAGQPFSPRWQQSPTDTSTASNTSSSLKEQAFSTTNQLPSLEVFAQPKTQLCSAGGVPGYIAGKQPHAAVYQRANLGKSPPNHAKTDDSGITHHAAQSTDTAGHNMLAVYESFILTADARNPAAVLQEGWDALERITQQQQLAVTSLDLSAVRKAAAKIAAQQT